MLSDTVTSARLELIEVPTGLGDPYDGNIQVVPFDQRLKRGENLLVSEIAGCAKEYESIGMRIVHPSHLSPIWPVAANWSHMRDKAPELVVLTGRNSYHRAWAPLIY